MAVFTAPMPESDSNPLAEIAALRAWAFMLISQLRTVLYSLDGENIKSVRAESVKGILNESSLPELPADKLYGTADFLEVEAQNGITLKLIDGNGNSSYAAEIYYQPSGDKPGLHINSEQGVYINGTKM